MNLRWIRQLEVGQRLKEWGEDTATMPFFDNYGRIMRLPKKTTMRELVEMGMSSIEIVPKGTPLRDGWWQAAP